MVIVVQIGLIADPAVDLQADFEYLEDDFSVVLSEVAILAIAAKE